MVRGSLSRYDVQAKWSLLASLVSLVLVILVAVALRRNYVPDLKVIVFGEKSPYKLAVLGATALAILLSTAGLVLGINSAGQRRNEFQKRSWAGFFLGAGALSLTIVLFVAFWTLQMALPTGGAP